MGGEWLWWVVVVVLTCCPGAPPVSLFLLNPLSSLLYPNPPYSPLVGCVTSFVGQLRACRDEGDSDSDASTCRVCGV